VPRGLSVTDVRRIAAGLEGVEESTAYGAFCLKVNKTMIACVAINKDAEPNSLMIRLPIDQRDELIAEAPDVYYVKPHYEPHPCVLVRLGRVDRDALKDLLTGAWRRASAHQKRSPRSRTRRAGS
jgi:hypothetical protein